jgi:protein MpaA
MSQEKKILQILVKIILVLITIAIQGCFEVKESPILIKNVYLPPAVPGVKSFIAGYSVYGNPIECYVIGDGPDTIMYIATIHGNENAGTPLLKDLMSYLQQKPFILKGKKVVIVPVVNPDGLMKNIRYNANNIDLNRNYPADNRVDNQTNGLAPLSEPESVVLFNLINNFRPNRMVAIHQPLVCIDYDGPSREIALNMAKYCNLPVKKLGARPGSLGSYVGEMLNTPIITVELLEEDSKYTAEVLWDKYGLALVSVIRYNPNTQL